MQKLESSAFLCRCPTFSVGCHYPFYEATQIAQTYIYV